MDKDELHEAQRAARLRRRRERDGEYETRVFRCFNCEGEYVMDETATDCINCGSDLIEAL